MPSGKKQPVPGPSPSRVSARRTGGTYANANGNADQLPSHTSSRPALPTQSVSHHQKETGTSTHRTQEDRPLQVQEQRVRGNGGSEFSSTIIPPTPVKTRPPRRSLQIDSTKAPPVEFEIDQGHPLRRPNSTSTSISASSSKNTEGQGLAAGAGIGNGRSFSRSASATELGQIQLSGDLDPSLRVPKTVRRGSSGSNSGDRRSIGGDVRSRSGSQEGSSLGQAYVPANAASRTQSSSTLSGRPPRHTYSHPVYMVPHGQEVFVQPLQPQPRALQSGDGYVLYPPVAPGQGAGRSRSISGDGPSEQQQQHGQHQQQRQQQGQQQHGRQIMRPASGAGSVSDSGSTVKYYIEHGPGYYEDRTVPEYGYAIGPAPVYPAGYPQPQPQPGHAVQYYQTSAGYPVRQQYTHVDARGFVIPDRSASVSRTSSRSAGQSAGHARYRRSEGEGAEEGDDTASVHSLSSNSAAFHARILAGMGTTGAAAGASEKREKRPEMGDTLKVPGTQGQSKGKDKEKKGQVQGGSSGKTKGKKRVSAGSSTGTKDTVERDSDVESSRPTPWTDDLRPGDTVTNPDYPTAHGCPYCEKVYTGQHARSICRRHQMSKHGIELEVQVKKSRWDNNPNRPANEAEKHRRTLESKRRWAAKDRQVDADRVIS